MALTTGTDTPEISISGSTVAVSAQDATKSVATPESKGPPDPELSKVKQTSATFALGLRRLSDTLNKTLQRAKGWLFSKRGMTKPLNTHYGPNAPPSTYSSVPAAGTMDLDIGDVVARAADETAILHIVEDEASDSGSESGLLAMCTVLACLCVED